MKKVKIFKVKIKGAEEREAIESRLSLVRKQTGLEIIANIAMQTGDYEHFNNVDLKLELIQSALGIIRKKD